MVLDHITNAHLYYSLHPRFKEAFEQLRNVNENDFSGKKKELDGNDFFLLFFDGEGKGKEGVKLECHQKYLDIHYVFKGSDRIGYRATNMCSDPHTDNLVMDDYKLFNDQASSEFVVNENYFAVFFPGDAHAPLMGSGKFMKIVAKILV